MKYILTIRPQAKAEALIHEYRRILLRLAAGEERVERLVRDPLAA